jgi:hypothetical protein
MGLLYLFRFFSLPELVNLILTVFGEGFLKDRQNCANCTMTSQDEQLFFVESQRCLSFFIRTAAISV